MPFHDLLFLDPEGRDSGSVLHLHQIDPCCQCVDRHWLYTGYHGSGKQFLARQCTYGIIQNRSCLVVNKELIGGLGRIHLTIRFRKHVGHTDWDIGLRRKPVYRSGSGIGVQSAQTIDLSSAVEYRRVGRPSEKVKSFCASRTIYLQAIHITGR